MNVPYITVSRTTLDRVRQSGYPSRVCFVRRDGGSVYIERSLTRLPGIVSGIIRPSGCRNWFRLFQSPNVEITIDASGTVLSGAIRRGPIYREATVQVADIHADIHARSAPLLETNILADRCVLIAGLGSVGAHIAVEQAKAGVGRFILLDDDRIETANVGRHAAGLDDLGRLKTEVVKDLILGKNPGAGIERMNLRVGWDTVERVRAAIRSADLVISSIDDDDGKAIVNLLCVEERRRCLFAGAYRRAYGVQILRYDPGKTLCYECFKRSLPQKARDREISQNRARHIAYADRPVKAEPGLSVDIAPVSTMTSKLAIQWLLAGKATTLRSLDDDLTASWMFWANRRELDSPFEDLDPLGCSVDGVRILRWYGVEIAPDPACPVCGDYVKAASTTRDDSAVDPDYVAKANNIAQRRSTGDVRNSINGRAVI